MMGSYNQIIFYLRRLSSMFGIANHSKGVVKGGVVARLTDNINTLSKGSSKNQLSGEESPWAVCGVKRDLGHLQVDALIIQL